MRLLPALLFTACSAVAFQAAAGAWTQKAGHGQIILNALYYSTKTLYTNQGSKQAQSRYSKYEINPYFEYGLTDAITIGSNLSFQHARQNTNPLTYNSGSGDSEFFARARLWQQDGFVVSLEPMFKLPSPDLTGASPKLGGQHPDIGMGLSAGYGFSALGQHHFVNADVGYRKRFGAPENQIKWAGTLGMGINDRLMIMPQVFVTYRTDKPANVTFKQTSGDDYNLVKLQISGVYTITSDVSLQLGAFKHASGRNVGAGNGALLSIWKRF